MGVAFYPVFEDGTGGWPEDMNGKCLASAATRLDRAINHTGVGSIFNYFSPTRDQSICELPDADPDDPTTFDEADVPPESWFEVEAGLRTIREMLSHVRNGDEKIEVIECVREDLEVFERLLVDAATRGVRWHLVIDA